MTTTGAGLPADGPVRVESSDGGAAGSVGVAAAPARTRSIG